MLYNCNIKYATYNYSITVITLHNIISRNSLSIIAAADYYYGTTFTSMITILHSYTAYYNTSYYKC
jgi:hypothetical protein